MAAHVLTTLLLTLVAGWLMLAAGVGKRRLELRPCLCRQCGRPSLVCRCRSRR